MSSSKKYKPSESNGTAKNASASINTEEISVNAWKSSERRLRRDFPGPRGASALMRVAMERGAFAELIAHAKESLEKEICGVLAGKICEDSAGLFVHVGAVIRGAAAAQGSTHVTFTQETWQHVHKTLERDFSDLQIVGWYHSHPGFGVQFSEMDLFIQKNFFSGPAQIALVIDPLSGAIAICLNTDQGIQYLDRFWVDGREQICQVPAIPAANAPPFPQIESSTSTGTKPTDQALEARLGQLGLLEIEEAGAKRAPLEAPAAEIEKRRRDVGERGVDAGRAEQQRPGADAARDVEDVEEFVVVEDGVGDDVPGNRGRHSEPARGGSLGEGL